MKAIMGNPGGGGVPKYVSVFVLVEGILLVLFGLAAFCFPAFAGIATAVLLGWILIASGAAGLAGTFAGGGYTHAWWSLFSSVLAIVAGLLMVFNPFAGAMVLVLVIAAWLFLDGIGSLMIALNLRRTSRPSWGWLAGSAVVDWLLAGLILFLNPVASVLAVGLIVGIDLVVGGAALIGMGWSLRASANDAE
jgi:uncharacterized membrane protein HdeD (DUF308 family)